MKITVQMFNSRKENSTIIEKAKYLLTADAVTLHSALSYFSHKTEEKFTLRTFESINEFYSYFGATEATVNELIEKGYIVKHPIVGHEMNDCYKFYENGTLSANDVKTNFMLTMSMMNDNYYVVREWMDRKEF